MVSSARIEELERKFNENPRRYFAPLANEYRKAGDLQQAIAICRTYLPQQPAHISGHIVFGQALFEAGEFEEARTVFESALGLDPENLIALRHLGDIASGRGDISLARAWYQRVLDADPRNPEIVSLIASLGVVTTPPPPPPTHEATYGMQHAGSVHATDDASGWGRINPEQTLELPRISIELRQPETPVASEAIAEPVQEAHSEQPAEPSSEADSPHSDSQVEPPVAEARSADAGAAAETAPPAEQSAPQVHEESPASVDATPPLAAEVQGLGADVIRDDQAVDAAFESHQEAVSGLEPMEFVSPSHAAAADESTVASANVSAEDPDDLTPSAFVTETMAELYVQQGFRQEALDVYLRLLRKSPNDATLIDRIKQLEAEIAELGPMPTPGRSDSDASGWPSSSAQSSDLPPDDAEREHTEDHQSVAPANVSIRAFFAHLLGRRVISRGSTSSGSSDKSGNSDHWGDAGDAGDAGDLGDSGAFGDPPEVAAQLSPEDIAHDVLGEGAFGAGSFDAGHSGSPDFVHEQASEFTFAGSSEFHDTASFDTGAFGTVQPDPAGSGAEGGNASRRELMQAGSVNVLFPTEPVLSTDEAAATALSEAFGGPASSRASGGVAALDDARAPGRAHSGARSASDELSLDSIFRDEDAERGESHASRASGKFSFDQFFGDVSSESGHSQASHEGPLGAADAAPDATEAAARDSLAFDTEQFTDWLAGLKKK